MVEDGNTPLDVAFTAEPAPAADAPPADAPRPGPDPLAEVLAPTQVTLRTEGGDRPGRPGQVLAALTADALWLQDTWQLRQVPLRPLDGIEAARHGRELVLSFRPEPSAERLRLTFAGADVGQRWHKELQARQQQLPPEAPPGDRAVPEGVALVKRAPRVPHAVLDRVTFTGPTPWAADRGLQLRAGMRGADAVFEVERQKCPELGWGARCVSGLAVRVADAADRQRVRLRWYREEVGALVNRLLLLVGIQAAVLFVAAVFRAGVSPFHPATGEALPEALRWAGLGLALVAGWPLVLLALLRVLCWPQLLPAVGVAVLAATTGRMLAVWLAHLLAARITGVPPENMRLWVLADPLDWAFVIAGAVLCVRAWRLAGDARHILPPELRAVSAARKAWARGLLALTGAYALGLLGFVGTYRYQVNAHLLQPGVDPKREQQALLALNQGAAQASQGNLTAAEESLQRALRLWEELTSGRPAPSLYRLNLAMTLNDLGWIRERQGRPDEAEKYYARAAALADELDGDPQVGAEFKQTLAGARAALAELRGGKALAHLDEKDQAAVRKYEEAQVKTETAPAEAESLCREAIAAWEEILPLADNEEYRKGAVGRLATAYLRLGQLQQQLGKRPQAEENLKKAIEYGEKAVAGEPGRPLPRHNLELARRTLEGVREQALQEELTRLCDAQRFADAIDLCTRGVEEQEARVRSGTDRDAAVRRLAYRLDRLAWLLAHCPDERVRDTKAAVKHARRATEVQPDAGEYWYTLAMVQYRHGAWRDSLASLDQVKAREGGFDASSWLLVAMNRHQLKQRPEARAALRQAAEWMREQQRKAEDNPALRIQYEMMRPGIESLKREAETLIEGKDPAGVKAG
jgi:tetratricopeptide (TPR) repeat protein